MNSNPSFRKEGVISDVFPLEDGRVSVRTYTPDDFPDLKALDHLRISTNTGDCLIVQVLGIEFLNNCHDPLVLGRGNGGLVIRWNETQIEIALLEGASFTKVEDV